MKNNNLLQKSIIILMLFFFSTNSFSQIVEGPVEEMDRSDQYYSKAITFMQGEGILETWFTEGFMPLYDQFMLAEYSSYILFGQALAGVCALLYLGLIGFQMISGDKEWEILPILKPFAISLILMNWVGFVQVIKTPLVALQTASQADFNESQSQLGALRMQRYKKQVQVVDAILEAQGKARAEIAQQDSGNKTIVEEGLDMVGNGITSLISPIYEMYARLQIDLQLVVSALLETIGLWILRICTYFIFFVQIIFSTVLIIIGPIAVAISIIPMFASSFGTWLARFININLYGFIAFIVLRIGVLLQIFAFEAEIDRYNQMINANGTVKNMDLILAFAGGGIMSFGLVVICFILSGIGMLAVPTLANYVVSTGSNASTMSKAARAGKAIASGGKSLIMK